MFHLEGDKRANALLMVPIIKKTGSEALSFIILTFLLVLPCPAHEGGAFAKYFLTWCGDVECQMLQHMPAFAIGVGA